VRDEHGPGDPWLPEGEADLYDRLWLARHLRLRRAVEEGRATVAPRMWREALRAAELVRAAHPDGLGPWSDQELGELHGRLAVARWAQGLG
jgi:hypothetical protein